MHSSTASPTRAHWAQLGVLLLAACHPTQLSYPWSNEAGEAGGAGKSERSDVRTLNASYDRMRSRVLVREVSRPTRAALDYAAYHANFMIADEGPERPPAAPAAVRVAHPWQDMIVLETLTPNMARTELSAQERAQPLSYAALSAYLAAHKVRGAEAFAELGAAVRSEQWGQPSVPGLAPQTISEVFLHTANQQPTELWVKVEFAPWFKGLGDLPDADGDGYPEVYGRARADRLSAECVAEIERDYRGRTLTPAEIKTWANQLASYWYPSFNTDLIPAGSRWPDAQTEPEIVQELSGLTLSSPAIVLRGKPQGEATYDVFVIDALPVLRDTGPGEDSPSPTWTKTQPTPAPTATAARIAEELAAHGGGSWDAWNAKVAPAHNALRRRLKASPSQVKAFAGREGWVFFRNSLEFVVGGDLEQQKPGKNPLPIIVDYQRTLARLGVDFLFVPVPAKVEIYPDAFDATLASWAGKPIHPALRKLEASLSAQGVEVLDLHAPFLAARSDPQEAAVEPLYQHQDTHWSARGLELAAQLVAARIQQYPWYTELARHAQPMTTGSATFTRFGDLHSRLPAAQQKNYQPESLVAHPVLGPLGKPYEDDPESPIVVLGDSFTGVYELTDADHAGLSAHVARGVSYPVDLVMSYGGGPNVRNKLMRRGAEALARKKLVVWVMADRDLYNYWEDWQPLKDH